MNKVFTFIFLMLSITAFAQNNRTGFAYCDRTVDGTNILYMGRKKPGCFTGYIATPQLKSNHTLREVSFPSNTEDPKASIVVLNSDTVAIFTQPISVTKGWNTHKLTSPLTLKPGMYYIGVSIHNSKQPSVIPFDGQLDHAIPEACFYQTENEGSTFGLNKKPSDFINLASEKWGCIMLFLDIVGPDTENIAYVTFLSGDFIGKASSRLNMDAKIRNIGTNAINSLSFGISNPVDQTLDVTTNIAIASTGDIKIPYTMIAKGTYIPADITLNKVNGKDNFFSKTKFPKVFSALRDGGPFLLEDVLIEYFTTEKCGWCPTWKPTVEQTIKSLKEKGLNVNFMSQHTGFQSDWLTIEPSVELKRHCYNMADGAFAPGLMFNRALCGDKNACVMSVTKNTEAKVLSLLKEYLQFAKIEKFEYKEDGFLVSGKITDEVDKDKVFLHLVLCEDNIEAKKQLGAKSGEKYIHMGVPRAFAYKVIGEKIKINDDLTFSVNVPAIKLKSDWKKENLYAVCFLTGDMGKAILEDCPKKIVYASKTAFSPKAASAQELAKTPLQIKAEGRKLVINGDYEQVFVFDLTGKIVSMPDFYFNQAGTYIVSVKTANNLVSQKLVIK